MTARTIVALAGGVGAARFLQGLAQVVNPRRMFVVGNTADDAEIQGLHISPDLDTVTYTLAGMANPKTGWGIKGDTFRCLESLKVLGADAWFLLGDRDLATHIYRTRRLREGATLSEVTREIVSALKVECAIVPMSNDAVRTRICTPRGELEFQTYFVKHRTRDRVTGIRFEGASYATPAPGVLDAIANAEGIILCPSNPFISIGPILAIPGIREALRARRERVVAVSPIVGGKAIKGPTAKMMQSQGMPVTAAEVAKLYSDCAGVFVLDEADRKYAPAVTALDMRPVVAKTVMHGMAQKKALARVVVRELGMRA
jgi:LPPG:FO 2-phospho-L-lactate transferase